MTRVLILLAMLAWSGSASAYESKLGDDGLHKQDWFLNSFLDLKEDLADATKSGKRFAILWEQKGCPYCADLHVVNFADDATREWIKAHFVILQLNLWGSREVTDFDGQVLPEKELARKYRITFTPTVQYFPETAPEIVGKKGADMEVARLPGYFRNLHFQGMFEYVWDKRYAKGQDFQRFIKEKAEASQR